MPCTDRAATLPRVGLLALGVLVIVLAPASPVQAREEPATPNLAPPEECEALVRAAASAPERQKYTLDGIPGIWFPSPVAAAILCEVKVGRLRHRELSLMDRELSLTLNQVEFTEQQLKLVIDSRAAAMEAAEAAERRRARAEARLDSWSRSPTLWFALGAGAAVLVFGLSVYAIDSLRSGP